MTHPCCGHSCSTRSTLLCAHLRKPQQTATFSAFVPPDPIRNEVLAAIVRRTRLSVAIAWGWPTLARAIDQPLKAGDTYIAPRISVFRCISIQMSVMTSSRDERSAAHRCFAINELFEIIAAKVHDGGMGRRSVLNLALTCQSFRDISLSTLWTSMDSLVPLFKTLPSDTWDEVESRGRESTVLVLKSDMEFDMARFQYYGQYIRQFRWANEVNVSASTLEYLFAQFPPWHCLLTQARLVLWVEDRQEAFHYVIPFISELVEELYLISFATDPTLVLTAVEERSAQLKTLAIKYCSRNATVDRALAQLLDSAACLRDFTCTISLSKDAIFALARMSHLKALDIAICEAVNISHLRGPKYPCFPALQSLGIRFSNLDIHSLALLESIRSPHLRKISLLIDKQASIFTAHLDALARAPFGRSLCELSCRCMDYLDDVPSQQAHNLLLPLLRMSALTTLTIIAPLLMLDPGLLRDLACALPRIRYLHLHSSHSSGHLRHSTPITLEAFLPFAERCHELEYLGFRIDATRVPSLPASWQSHSRVSELYVGDAAINSSEEVAAYLTRVFPVLKGVHYVPGLTIPPIVARNRMQKWCDVASLQPQHKAEADRVQQREEN